MKISPLLISIFLSATIPVYGMRLSGHAMRGTKTLHIQRFASQVKNQENPTTLQNDLKNEERTINQLVNRAKQERAIGALAAIGGIACADFVMAGVGSMLGYLISSSITDLLQHAAILDDLDLKSEREICAQIGLGCGALAVLGTTGGATIKAKQFWNKKTDEINDLIRKQNIASKHD